MNKKILAAALTLGFTTLAAGAMASPRGYTEGYRDGYVNGRTVAHATPAASLFQRLDRNNNGVISNREFTRHYGNSRATQRTFARLDANHNGVLSQREVATGQRFIAGL